MKKLSIIIFSILTLLTPVFFTNAFGSASLVASGVTENYVALNISNFPANTDVNISVYPALNSNDKSEQIITSNASGVVNTNFSGLISDTNYIALAESSDDFDNLYIARANFTTLKKITGKISVVNSNTDITSNSISLKVDLSLSGVSYFVQIYKNGDTSPLDYKDGVSTGNDSVTFTNLTPNTNYKVSLFARDNDTSLNNYTFTTNELTGATVNTFDLQSTSASLEFHNLPVGGTFSAFVKADKDNGNTTGYYHSSLIPSTTKISDIVYAEKFTDLVPGSAYVGGIVGDIDVHFLTPLTDIVGVDYSKLEQTILTATDLVTSVEIKEGTAVGQYPVGSKDILNTALQAAKTDYEFVKNNSQDETIEAMQSRVNSDITELQMAIDAFKAKIVGGSVSTTDTKTSLASKGGGLLPECPTEGCGFNELMQLINNAIKFLLFTIATPLAALGIVYAGWLYLSSGGNTENTTKAKKILTNIVIGYIIALAAWLIVNTIVTSLGLDSSIDTFLK